MTSAAEAAWVQAGVSLLALAVAIFIPYWQRYKERQVGKSWNRKTLMSVAANLEISLRYESAVLDFSPTGEIPGEHGYTLERARNLLKLRPQTHEVLRNAIDKSPYFSEATCEAIVQLGIEATAFDRIVEDRFRKSNTADELFQSVKASKERVSSQVSRVRGELRGYLPKTVYRPLT